MGLRLVEVTYEDNIIICTSMSAHLTDEEIKNYFRIGRTFNIGSYNDIDGGDLLRKVIKVNILK